MSPSHTFLPPFDNPTRYAVGALQYATLTRPDIAFAVNKACQFMQAPIEQHWTGVKRILRYLHGSLQLGLRFRHDSGLTLQAFSDLDWVGCPLDRHSTGDMPFI